MWYTSPLAFVDIVMSVKDDKCLSFLARPTRCGTPVPQPLNLMNNVKAKDMKRFVAGEWVSEV